MQRDAMPADYPPQANIYVNSAGIYQAITPTIPSGVVNWAQIVLLNKQPTAQNSTFPAQVTINANFFQGYLATDLKNAFFFDSNGNTLTSWLEGPANLNGNVIYYVNLSSIGASSSAVIYYGMKTTATNVYEGIKIGAAPDLVVNGSTYAQYDNGSTLFPDLYQNFAGTTVPSGWTGSASGVTINNGATVVGPGGGNVNYLKTNAATFGNSTSKVLEFKGFINQSSSLGSINMQGFLDTTVPMNNWFGWKGFASDYYTMSGDTGVALSNTSKILGSLYNITSNIRYNAQNYTQYTTSTPASAAQTVAFRVPDAACTMFGQWVRQRTIVDTVNGGTTTNPIIDLVTLVAPSNLYSLSNSAFNTLASVTYTPSFTGKLKIEADFSTSDSALMSITLGSEILWNALLGSISLVKHFLVSVPVGTTITLSFLAQSVNLGTSLTLNKFYVVEQF